jgi:hypothetical protein
MKRILYITICALAITPVSLLAQNETDALRYSQTTFGGTARFMAMRGAFCAVGGDPSTLAFNPAGIAVFAKSQFTFTPGFSFQNTSSTYNGMLSTGQMAGMNVQNLAWISTWKNRHDDAMWKGLNFGIAYNRTNNFNSNITIQGNSNNSTYLDQVVNDANGTYYGNLDVFETSPAYQVGLIYPNSSDSSHYGNIVRPYLGNANYVMQQKSISTNGSMGETDISFGANYNNKLYLGATIGIPDIRYTENVQYTETPTYKDTTNGLQSYNYNTSLTTTGGGINFKVGAIYRITDWLRIGAAIHSPTFFSLTDDYSTNMSATYGPSNNPAPAGTYTSNGNESSFNYTLITPMRVMGGLAFIIHHQGILSVDYEYMDYSTASLNSSDYTFSGANQAIAQNYMAASNIRVGAEWVLFPFSIRAGYAMYGNPYSSIAGNNVVTSNFSGGFGIRIKQYAIDLAYVLTQYKANYYLYNGSNAASNQTSISNVALTFTANL